MTAFNIVAQPDAAYIINDTAHYDHECVIRAFAPKTVVLTHALLEPAAISVCGAISARDLIAIISDLDISSGSQAIRDLGKIHARAMDVVRAKGRDPVAEGVWLALATFDMRTGRAAGHVIAGDAGFGGLNAPPYTPGTVNGGALGHYVTCDWQTEFGPQHNFSDPRQFSAFRDGQRMLEAQRRTVTDRFSVVGGQGVVTRVSRRGVESFVVCQWPDKIGERIHLDYQPDRVGERIAA